jgi:hypothetical protein
VQISNAIYWNLLDVTTVVAFETANTLNPMICNVMVWKERTIVIDGKEMTQKYDEKQKSMLFQDVVKLPHYRIIAMGMIQFTAATLARFHHTFDTLAALDMEEHARLVVLYLHPQMRKVHSLEDLYLAILYPAAMGLPDEHVVFRGPDARAYRQNKGLDRNKDGVVTKGEICAKIRETRELVRPYV